MKSKNLSKLTLALMVACSTPALAEEFVLIVEGDLAPGELQVSNGFPVDNLSAIAGYRAEIAYESEFMIYRDSSYMTEYDNDGFGGITSIEIIFVDSDGQPVPQSTFPTSIPVADAMYGGEGDDYDFQYLNYDSRDMIDSDRYYYSSDPQICYVNNQCSVIFSFDVYQGSLPLLFDDGVSIVPEHYFGNADHSATLRYYLDGGYGLSFGSASIHSIYLAARDGDNDGVSDDVDSCPASLTDETVMFGEYDSGVTNYVDEAGCTIMDRYAACEADQEEQNFTRRSFSFYRGPSYCEKQVAYGLVSDGVIDYSEARLLRDALYRSHR